MVRMTPALMGHHKLEEEEEPKRSRHLVTTSLVSLAFMMLVLTTIVTWHGGQPNRQGGATPAHIISNSRFLVMEEEEGTSTQQRQQRQQRQQQDGENPIDDDSTRSETCRKYLMNFLNGTTDVNDQCQAFKNAYDAADCQDDTHVDILLLGKKKKNSSNDDLYIDDFFENFECCDSIERIYTKNCEGDNTKLNSVRLLGIMLVLLVCTSVKAVLKRLAVRWLPDACAFILVGAIVGGILQLINKGLVQTRLSFDNDLFLQILLPPIIFQAALSIDKRAFRRDLFPILAFAGLGTAFSAISIGFLIHYSSQWWGGIELEDGSSSDGHLPLMDSLVFGALISSIDPVATLSILSGVGVSQTDTLYTLIFGESLLNDGVAIVLFDTLRGYLGQSEDVLDKDAFQAMAIHFCIVLFGSIGIGVGVGMCCTLYFWSLRGRQTAVTEVMIFFCWALIPYYIADGLGCSGIISIMVMGFFMDYYVIGGFQSEETAWMDYMIARQREDENGVTMPPQELSRWVQLQTSFCKAFSGRGHILSRSRHHVGFVAEVMASLMDTAIFAYLGLFLFNENMGVWFLNLTAILSCVSSRAVMVVGLGFLINIAVFFDFENNLSRCFRACRGATSSSPADDDDSVGSHTRVYLDRKTQVILLLAGVRGAVSFALVENIPVWDAVTQSGSKYKAELKGMTCTSIVFTLFVFGALTYITVQRQSENDPLTQRLMSEPLDSDDGEEDDDELQSSDMNSLEIEHSHSTNNHSHHHNNNMYAPAPRHPEQVAPTEPYHPPVQWQTT